MPQSAILIFLLLLILLLFLLLLFILILLNPDARQGQTLAGIFTSNSVVAFA
jgi:hypothetical protein